MGLFSVECVIENQQHRTRTVRMSNVLVDTGSELFGEVGDLQLLGARTLEGLNLRVDSRNRKLVVSGPLIAARQRRTERRSVTTPTNSKR